MSCQAELPGLVHALLETAPIGIAVLDAEFRYRHINQLLADSNGYPVAAHLGQRPRDLIPDAGPALEEIMQHVLDSGLARTHFAASAQVPPGSGRMRYWEASYYPLPGKDGHPSGIIAMVEDVSARYQAERLQRESDAHIRRVLDQLFTFVGVLGPDGTLQSANRAPLDAAGISINEVLGLKFWDCYWWNYAPHIQVQIQHAVTRAACGEASRFDIVIRVAGERQLCIDFMLAPLRDDQGRITHLVASGNDISARKRSENALRESEALLRQVVEAMPQGLLMVDGDGLIRLVNSQLEQLLGYPRATLLGQPFGQLLLPLPEEDSAAAAHGQRRLVRQRNGSLLACHTALTTLQVNGSQHTLVSLQAADPDGAQAKKIP